MNRRLLIPIGAGVAFVILWFIALYGPQSSSLSDAKKRATDAAQQTATLRDQLKSLQQAQQSQPLKQSQLETLRVAIPDTPNLAEYILDANDAASKAGIDFLSITPTPPSSTTPGATTPTTVAGAPAGGTGATAVPITITMTATGGYFQVLDFVNRLNTLARLVVIDSLQLTTSVNGSLSVNMTERIFTASQAPVSGGASGGGTTSGSTTTTSPGSTTTTTRPVGG